MKNTDIIFLVCVLVAFSVCLAASISVDFIVIVNTSAAIIGALATVATLYVALLLYNRFKIDQNVLDKQGERVVELLVILRKICFWINVKNNSLVGTQADRFQLNMSTLQSDENSSYFEKLATQLTSSEMILLFDDEYLNAVYNLEKRFSDGYTPKSINDKLKEYSFIAFTKVELNPPTVYGLVEPSKEFLSSIGKWRFRTMLTHHSVSC